MLRTRLIPVLLLKNGILVRSRGFSFHQSTGNHIYQVKRFSEWKADEIIYLDISRSSSHSMNINKSVIGSTSSNMHKADDNEIDMVQIIKNISKVCRVPLTVGGRVKSLEDIRYRLAAGADKVAINSQAIDNPNFIAKSAKEFGSQCIVVSIDVKKDNNTWKVYKEFGKVNTNMDIDEWAVKTEELGAGEILIQSIDRDGSGSGYDLELINHITSIVQIPVIALGGVGNFDHLVDGYKANNAIALAAANIFHFTEQSVLNAKKHLDTQGINIRI
jgi:imidazole glycerol-phosphate synthase subunit HisF